MWGPLVSRVNDPTCHRDRCRGGALTGESSPPARIPLKGAPPSDSSRSLASDHGMGGGPNAARSMSGSVLATASEDAIGGHRTVGACTGPGLGFWGAEREARGVRLATAGAVVGQRGLPAAGRGGSVARVACAAPHRRVLTFEHHRKAVDILLPRSGSSPVVCRQRQSSATRLTEHHDGHGDR